MPILVSSGCVLLGAEARPFVPRVAQGEKAMLARPHKQQPAAGGRAGSEDGRERLISLVEEHVDVGALLEIAGRAGVPALPEPCPAAPSGGNAGEGGGEGANEKGARRVRLGVARDAAFGLCYSE